MIYPTFLNQTIEFKDFNSSKNNLIIDQPLLISEF
jgi:hypothetical protein